MSSATPIAGTPATVSAESLLEKYNLPEGTSADAIARVLARLGDLPVSSAEKKHGDPAVADPRGAHSGGAQMDATAHRDQMRLTSGGEPVARVSWSPASPVGTARESNGRHAGPDSPTTPGGDPLALIQDLYGDDVEEAVRASARRALTAAGYGSPVTARASPAPASPAGRASASRPARPGSGSAARLRSASVAAASISERPTPLTSKETMGKLGELRYEARAATQRARRAERALRGKDQELEELKAKCASLARERSALSARLSAGAPAKSGVQKTPFGAASASHGSSAFAPPSTNAGGAKTPKSPFSTTPRKPSGESLSLSSRWNQWEMEARRGDKRLAMLMRGYKEIEGELEAAHTSARIARESLAFSEDELEATRGALEELRGNFEAAKELLNEGLEARDALERRVRAETKKNAAIAPELESLREKNERLEADAEASREKMSEVLRRAVQRDRKIDTLSKKLAAAAEAAAASEKAREKAEEEATRVDEQCRALRRRVAAREAQAKMQESSAGEDDARRAALAAELEAARDENATLSAELDIKEEECNMLASMVSSTRCASLKTRSASAMATAVSEGVSPLKAAL